MIENQKELFSNILSQLPIRVKSYEVIGNEYLIKDYSNDKYLLKIVDKSLYLSYLEISKLKHIRQAVFIEKKNDLYILVFKFPYYKSDRKAVLRKIIPILEAVFNETKFLVTLKKQNTKRLNSIYKVLDNKFSYFEIRIREIETSIIKDDISWLMLSNYNIILDAKMLLYDLQQDIFNLVDKNTEISYGIVFKKFNLEGYYNNKILPEFDIYLAPISMLYVRLYLEFNDDSLKDEIYNKIQKIDIFNKKYFIFMVIYIYILNINLDTFLNNYSIFSVIEALKGLKNFMNRFYTLLK